MTSTDALEQQTRLGAPPEVLAVLTALADAEAISTPTDRPTDA
jgi:hypothetical protein